MRHSSRQTKQNIQCVEVLVSRSYVRDRNQLSWTLSVYSLENHPVKKSHAAHNSEVFHFMLYDWNRSVKKLLEDQQVPYSIVGYFSPDSIHGDEQAEVFHSNKETELLSALNDLSDVSEMAEPRDQPGGPHSQISTHISSVMHNDN